MRQKSGKYLQQWSCSKGNGFCDKNFIINHCSNGVCGFIRGSQQSLLFLVARETVRPPAMIYSVTICPSSLETEQTLMSPRCLILGVLVVVTVRDSSSSSSSSSSRSSSFSTEVVVILVVDFQGMKGCRFHADIWDQAAGFRMRR